MAKKVAVVGLGAMGSMTAWRLVESGADVIGFDRFAPPHDRGAHAGESRLFRAAYLEGSRYVPALMESRDGWLDLQKKASTTLFHPTGILTVGRPDDEFVLATAKSARDNDLPIEMLGDADLASRYPMFHLNGNEVGVFDSLGGLLEPERAIAAALSAAVAGGADIRTDSAVTKIVETTAGVQVWVGAEMTLVDHVVVTAGAWSQQLLPDTFANVSPTELYLTWYLSSDGSRFAPERFPGTILKTDDLEDLAVGICLFPSLDGKLVKVGESIGGNDPVSAPDKIGRFVDPLRLQRLSDAVAKHVPSLRPAPVRVGTYVDGFTPGHRPRISSSSRITALAGFSGHGFKFAPFVGKIAARAALEGDLSGADLLFDIDHTLVTSA